MEGLPLGISNTLPSTQRPLYLAVAAHKLPEAMVVATIALSAKGRRFAYITLILFAAITPIASIFAGLWQKYYEPTTAIGGVLIPIVAGAFIQIATTIFFESGTLQHQLTTKKIASILLGVILALGMVWW
jgi:zinc transporter ZupT